MVGRDISDVLIAVQQKAYGTSDHCVTKQMICDQIRHKKAQKLELEKYAEFDSLAHLRNLKPLRS